MAGEARRQGRQVDDPLVEVSTDKVDAELPAPVAGTVTELLVEPDETVAVGTVLLPDRGRNGAPAGAARGSRRRADRDRARRRALPASGGNGDANATPVAARMAADHGIDLDALSGSGPRGRVTKDDVEAALDGGAAPEAPAGAETSRSAAPPPRSRASWTRAARSPRPPASARSPSTSWPRAAHS